MATLRLKCINQNLEWATKPNTIYSGNENIDSVAFEFCELWDGFAKTAVFIKENDTILMLLDDNGICNIPAEVSSTDGCIYIGVFGVKENKRRTSSIKGFYFEKGVASISEPKNPSLEIYQQILNQCTEAIIIAQSVRDDADSGKLKGEKGDKGDKGDKGEQGIQGIQGEQGEPGKTQEVDQSYNSESANAQSGVAVAQAISIIKPSEQIDLNSRSILESDIKYQMNFITGSISTAGVIKPNNLYAIYTENIIENKRDLIITVNEGWTCYIFRYSADESLVSCSTLTNTLHGHYVYNGEFIRICHLKNSNITGNIAITKEEGLKNISIRPYDAEVKETNNRLGDIEELYIIGKNLFDLNNVISGYILNGAKMVVSGNYCISNPIKVIAGEKIIASEPIRKVSLFKTADIEESELIEYIDINPAVDNYIYTPTSNGYVRFTIAIEYMSTLQIEVGEVSTHYEQHIKTLAQPFGLNNVLCGKKWAVCGDSFSSGGSTGEADNIITSGIYAGQNKVYSYLIGNRNNMIIQKLFLAGRTLAKPADDSFTNTLIDNYQTIDSDVDYITIYLGINDSHHRQGATGTDGEDVSGVIPLGTAADTDSSTFYGAWNVILPYLIENYPFAHIGIIVSNGVETEDYRTATIEMAKKYGIPYIDLNGDERTPCMLRSVNPNIDNSVKRQRLMSQAVRYQDEEQEDGTILKKNHHPNVYAHEYESYFIENFLRSL